MKNFDWTKDNISVVNRYIIESIENKISREDAMKLSAEILAAPIGSIRKQFAAFEAMLKGKVFKGNISTLNVIYNLERIEQVYGEEHNEKSILSVKLFLLVKNKWGESGKLENELRTFAKSRNIDIDSLVEDISCR